MQRFSVNFQPLCILTLLFQAYHTLKRKRKITFSILLTFLQTYLAITLSPIGLVSLLPMMTDCHQPYNADSDFSLMADRACHQSRYNLQFDILKAEAFDSCDSCCHTQSK